MNTAITAFCANCRGNESNCLYPNKIVVDGIQAFRKLVSYDYVFVEFKDNYRSNKNFIRAWGLPEDIDNDHSDKPEDWIYPADVAAFFTDVRYFIHYSRHHMKQKADKSPRPRFHVIFIIDEEDDYDTFANLKNGCSVFIRSSMTKRRMWRASYTAQRTRRSNITMGR